MFRIYVGPQQNLVGVEYAESHHTNIIYSRGGKNIDDVVDEFMYPPNQNRTEPYIIKKNITLMYGFSEGGFTKPEFLRHEVKYEDLADLECTPVRLRYWRFNGYYNIDFLHDRHPALLC